MLRVLKHWTLMCP